MKDKELDEILKDVVEMDKFSAEEALKVVQAKIESLKYRRRILYVAAMVSSIAAAAIIFFYSLPIVVVNSDYSPLSVNLPDGTEVVLKGGSEIKYNRKFIDNRNVKLSGEAFFDVARDVKHPFVIKVGSSVVRVLGTSFNVKHVLNLNNVEVFVKTGKVILENKHKKSVNLTALEFAVADKETVKKVDVVDKNYLAWKNRRFEFNNDSLSYVLNSLEDVYFCDFGIVDSSLNDLRISTTFYQLTLDEVVESIGLTLNLSYKKIENGYVFAKK